MFVPVTLLIVSCAGIWAGARCWLLLVRQFIWHSAGEVQYRREQGQRGSEQRVFIPLLIFLLLLNSVAPLVQALQFTAFWLITEVAIVAALALEIIGKFGIADPLARPLSRQIILTTASSLLAIIAFIVILLPGYLSYFPYLPTTGGNESIVVLLIRVQILVVGMTVGAMLAFVLIYLPALGQLPSVEKARSLLEVFPFHLTIIVMGIILTAITTLVGVLLSHSALASAANSYGLIFALEMALLCVLLAFSVVQGKIAYPQLRKAVRKYTYSLHRVKAAGVARGNLLEQLKQREVRLIARTRFLHTIARYEAATGTGLLLVGSLAYSIIGPVTLCVPVTRQSGVQNTSGPFTSTVMTTDNQFKFTLVVSPNHYGPNVFTVSIVEDGSDSPASLVDVSLSLTMLDMNMGTDTLRLHPNGPNRYSGPGNLGMTGNWLIRVLIRTGDNTMHEAQIKLLTPY